MKGKTYFYNRHGFTLLEVLFVILMIGIIASSFAPQWMQSQVDRKILNKVATEVQTRIDAARYYYVDNGVFPTSLYQLKTGRYLPYSVSDNTPFGGTYQYVATSNYFSVRIPNVPQRLQRPLITQLPNTTSSGSTVTTTVPPPGTEPITDVIYQTVDQKIQSAIQTLSQNINDLRYIGLASSGQWIRKPSCPPGKSPYIFLAPYLFNANGYPIVQVYPWSTSVNATYWRVWIRTEGINLNTNTKVTTSNRRVLVIATCL